MIWILILLSSLLAFLGFKKGFMTMFATLFNLMFAIFIAVLSTPKMLSFSPGFEQSPYYASGTMFLMFLLIFGFLQFFAWLYFLRDSEDLFPKMFDKVVSTVAGFLCGYLICCMILLSVCIMPCSRQVELGGFCGWENMCNIARPGVKKVCNFLAWYSLHCFEGDSEKTINYLLAICNEANQQDQEGEEGDSLLEDSPRIIEGDSSS